MTSMASWGQIVGAILLYIPAALLLSSPANANGGTIQVSMERAGPYAVTVVTDPSPIRVGIVDVSVLVERGGGDLVQDAKVMVTATSAAGPDVAASYEATHDRATNKLFYAADVPISRAGVWQIDVAISGSLGDGAVGFSIEAAEPGMSDRLPLLVLVAILIGLVVAAWVARSRGVRGWRSHPS